MKNKKINIGKVSDVKQSCWWKLQLESPGSSNGLTVISHWPWVNCRRKRCKFVGDNCWFRFNPFLRGLQSHGRKYPTKELSKVYTHLWMGQGIQAIFRPHTLLETHLYVCEYVCYSEAAILPGGCRERCADLSWLFSNLSNRSTQDPLWSVLDSHALTFFQRWACVLASK